LRRSGNEHAGSDGNGILFRAGLVKEMRPAVALFKEERMIMESTVAVIPNHPSQAELLKLC